MGTQLKFINARVSYPHLVEPRAVKAGDTPKYGAALIVSKADPNLPNLAAIAQQELTNMYGNAIPPTAKSLPMYDGDTSPGYAGKPEYAGCMILNTGSYDPVPVANIMGIPGSPEVIYSGCYADAHISIYAYGNKPGSMSKGTTFGLDGIQFRQDGDRLDNRPSPADMFAPIEGAPPPVAPGVVPPPAGAVPQGQQVQQPMQPGAVPQQAPVQPGYAAQTQPGYAAPAAPVAPAPQPAVQPGYAAPAVPNQPGYGAPAAHTPQGYPAPQQGVAPAPPVPPVVTPVGAPAQPAAPAPGMAPGQPVPPGQFG